MGSAHDWPPHITRVPHKPKVAQFCAATWPNFTPALTLSAGDNILWLEGVITFVGRQDNVVIRQAAMIALLFNLILVGVAIMSIMLTVPKGKPAERA